MGRYQMFLMDHESTFPRDPSTFSEGDWRHRYVGLEGPSTL